MLFAAAGLCCTCPSTMAAAAATKADNPGALLLRVRLQSWILRCISDNSNKFPGETVIENQDHVLVGGLICLLNCDNKRDLNLLNSPASFGWSQAS